MGIYTIIYLVNSLGLAINRKSKKIINYVVIAFLIFISGTRYYMGGVMYMYTKMYTMGTQY